ncbi:MULTISPECIES: hemolysin family protein [Paenibacillus]|jgi:CBS domain containing-hemolysin-like protein|uniref:Hemolysin family protein n=1 Tax=Paenibacillus timonensis TaxID=225915 RepID=A0ABW3SD40_9BACL|nr:MULTISPECIES: hemolysin family protein [Paenibacillus]MCH1640177.1 hemolysin family protein [Paenibacillus timonensis]MDU2242650.1 hemolysin family protein [Paenibacillus sp.]MDU4696061.1 hemolysin family protein [Paenibacillus sp.]
MPVSPDGHTEFEIGKLFWNLLLVLILVFLNGFFVAAEFSLVKVRQSRLTQLAREGNRRANYALKVNKRLDTYLSATQLGITLASLGLGWVGEPAVSELLIEPLMHKIGATDPTLISTISVAVGFAIITFLHIVMGELAPKSLAIQKSEEASLWLSWPLLMFYRLFLPVIWLLNTAANSALRLIGIEPAGEGEAAHSEEEIRILMDQSAKSGVIDKDEMKLVDNIFDFSDMLAREVMLPRTDMDCLYTNLSWEDNMKIVAGTKHSRYPVAVEDKDQIIGFVHITDLLLPDPEKPLHLEELVRPILNVPESMEISQVLRLMQKKHSQVTLVVDEYGGTAGLLTAEEILEEIVGDLHDEFEDERSDIEKLSDDVYSVDGRLLIEEVNDLVGSEIEDEEVDSIGGWLFKELEGTPAKGKRKQVDRFLFEVEEASRLRITRVKVIRLVVEEPDEEIEEE